MKIVKINRKKNITIKDLINKGIEVSDLESFIELQKRLFKLGIVWIYNGENIINNLYQSIFIGSNYRLFNNAFNRRNIEYRTKDLVENYNIFIL